MTLTNVTCLFYSPVDTSQYNTLFVFKQHEDIGMMTQYNVTGMEGAHWMGALDINPMCIMNGD